MVNGINVCVSTGNKIKTDYKQKRKYLTDYCVWRLSFIQVMVNTEIEMRLMRLHLRAYPCLRVLVNHTRVYKQTYVHVCLVSLEVL